MTACLPATTSEKPSYTTSLPSRRTVLLALLSLPMADVRVLAQHTGHLTIPLDQWGTLSFTFKGKTVEFTTADVFRILKGDTA